MKALGFAGIGHRLCQKGDCAVYCGECPPLNVAELNDLAVCTLYDEAERRAAQLLRENTITRLAIAIAADVKADCPTPLPSNQQQARELLGALGKQLNEAHEYLVFAAARLNKKGDGYGASQVQEMANRVQAAAQGLR